MIHETILVGGDRISHRGELYTYFLRNSQEMNPKAETACSADLSRRRLL